jgi:MFS transporter, ACS family, glucarate transporter
MTTPRRSPWSMVALLSATATAGYLCRVNLSTAGALLMEEFALTQVGMGRVFSAFLLGYALCQIPAGALADRFGARRILAVAALCWTVLTAAQSLVGWTAFPIGPVGSGTAMVSLLVLRFLLGVTAAPTYPGSARGIARWVLPHDRGRANGIVIASIGIGSALAPPLLSHVMATWGWRAALLVSALPSLVVALLWRRVAEPPALADWKPAVDRAEPAPRRFGSRGFALLTASYTLQGYVGYIFVFWFYLYLVQERKFDLLQGAWVSTLPWILSTVSIPAGGFLSDRLVASRLGPTWGRRAVPILGLGLSGVLIAIGAHTGSAATAAVALALATALVLCVEGPFWATMIGIAGPRSGTAGGIMNMGSNVGGLVSPVVTPLLAESIGWENALLVAAALSCIAAALWLGIDPEVERAPTSS